MESRMHQISDQFSRDFNSKARVAFHNSPGPKETYITDAQIPAFSTINFGSSANNTVQSLDAKFDKSYKIDHRIHELEKNAELAYVQWKREQEKLKEEKNREQLIKDSLERVKFEREQLSRSVRDQVDQDQCFPNSTKNSQFYSPGTADREYNNYASPSKTQQVSQEGGNFAQTQNFARSAVSFSQNLKSTNDDFNFHQPDVKNTSPWKSFHYHDEAVDYKNVDVEKLEAASKHCAACESKYKLILNMVNPYKEKQRMVDETIRKTLIQLKALFVAKKYHEAHDLVENTLNEGYKHADIYYMAGEIKRAFQLHREAENYYLQALTYQVHSPYIYQSLGFTYVDLNDHKRAIPLLKHFTEKIVSDSALFELGKCLAVCKSYLEATVYFTKAIQVNGKVGDYYLHRGDSYEALGFTKLAIDDYKAFTILTPNYREVFEKNIRDLERQGNFDEANSMRVYLRKIAV